MKLLVCALSLLGVVYGSGNSNESTKHTSESELIKPLFNQPFDAEISADNDHEEIEDSNGSIRSDGGTINSSDVEHIHSDSSQEGDESLISGYNVPIQERSTHSDDRSEGEVRGSSITSTSSRNSDAETFSGAPADNEDKRESDKSSETIIPASGSTDNTVDGVMKMLMISHQESEFLALLFESSSKMTMLGTEGTNVAGQIQLLRAYIQLLIRITASLDEVTKNEAEVDDMILQALASTTSVMTKKVTDVGILGKGVDTGKEEPRAQIDVADEDNVHKIVDGGRSLERPDLRMSAAETEMLV